MENAEPTVPGKLDPIGKLFADAWALFNDKGQEVFMMVVIPLTLVSLPHFTSSSHPFASSVTFLLAVLGIILFLPAIQAAIRIFDGSADAATYSLGWSMFWPLAWLFILQVFVVFGGFVMLIVPGFLMGIWFAFSQFTFVLEDQRGLNALARSRAYVDGYWWAVLGRSILIALVAVGVSVILAVPLGMALGSHIGGSLAGLVATLATFPFTLACSYAMYRNFKILKPEVVTAAPRGKTFMRVSAIIGLIVFILLAVALGTWIMSTSLSHVMQSLSNMSQSQ